MSSALETLSNEELYSRKDNLLKQIKKVDDEIFKRTNESVKKVKLIKVKIVKST